MSTITSIRVSKGRSKFAPKAKPRAQGRAKRANASEAKEPTDTTSATEDQAQSESAQESAQTTRQTTPTAAQQNASEARHEHQGDYVAPPIPAAPPPLIVAPTPQHAQAASDIPRVMAVRSPQKGTPIVVGAASSALSGSRYAPARAAVPTQAPGRLASINSPQAMSPLPTRLSRIDRTPSVGPPGQAKRRGKRTRSESSEPESALQRRRVLKEKTVDDYEMLPEDAISSMPMSFFCYDSKRGQPSASFIEKENEGIRKLMEPAKPADKQDTEEGQEPRPQEKSPAADKKTIKSDDGDAPAEGAGNLFAAQMRIVDGKVVLDSSSLTISRRDMAERTDETLEVVDETAQVRYINSMTYVKKKATRKRWSKEETDMFYRALRKYGTDFEIISSVVPGRNRYDIKNKFKAEEKIHGQWITDALLKRPPARDDDGAASASASEADADAGADAGAGAGAGAGTADEMMAQDDVQQDQAALQNQNAADIGILTPPQTQQ